MIAMLFALALASAETPEPAPFVTQPVWLAAPSGEDMARYRPDAAKIAGRAVVECTVSKSGLLEYCRVLEETAGEDFGKAALAISAKFRMAPQDRGGLPTAGRKVRLPLTWAQPRAASDTIQSPVWLRRPSGNDIAKAYPWKAAANGKGGRVTLVCRVLATGRLTQCEIVEETPADMGFGKAAVDLAPLFQMSPTTADGASVDGGTVRLPLVWQLPG